MSRRNRIIAHTSHREIHQIPGDADYASPRISCFCAFVILYILQNYCTRIKVGRAIMRLHPIYDGAVADGGAEERGNPYVIKSRVTIG
jgi:hypothetical protein